MLGILQKLYIFTRTITNLNRPKMKFSSAIEIVDSASQSWYGNEENN